MDYQYHDIWRWGTSVEYNLNGVLGSLIYSTPAMSNQMTMTRLHITRHYKRASSTSSRLHVSYDVFVWESVWDKISQIRKKGRCIYLWDIPYGDTAPTLTHWYLGDVVVIMKTSSPRGERRHEYVMTWLYLYLVTYVHIENRIRLARPHL